MTPPVRFGVAHDFRSGQTNPTGDARTVTLVGADGPPAARGRTTSGSTVVALDVEVDLP